MGSYVKAANKKKKASYAEVAVNNYGRIENNNYDEYEKNKKAYDLAMRIAAEDAAFSSDAQKVGNISKAYGGVYTGSQDPMHIMLGNHMGAFASSGVKGAADRAYDRIIKDAGQMAENGEIHKEDAEKIIRKAKYNRYYSDRYPETVKKAGKEQAEYIKDLGISNKEYPWYVKYKDLSSGGLKAAAEAAERARNGEKTIKAGSKEIDITKMADATDDEIEWLKNRSAAVLDRERYERYGKMDYHALKEAAAHTWDPKEKEWILSYAESTKKPEDYDTEIYEKWKTLKDLEDRYGYDEVSGRFKEDGSSLTTEGHKNRNAMLGEIISAKEDLARTQRQKDKRAGDLRKKEYYNSLKNNTDYGIYAGRNLPASSYAADIDVDQMTPYEAAGLDSRYDMDGKENNTPVVAGNELVMSDEEKKNYNYLYHTQGEQAAKDYLSFIQEDLNRRRAEVTAGNVKNYGTALLYSLGSGWNRGVPDAMSKLSNLFGGEEAVPVTEDEYVNSILSERYKDAGPKLFGRSIGQMGLETAENIGNMAPSMIASSLIGGPAGPVVGAAMMGISAGANTANEAWRDGNDRSRSIAYGVVNGMLEGGLQYALGGIASFGGAVSGLTKNALKNKIGGTLGKALMNLGISGLSEGTEEYLQEVLDPIVRNQLLGEKNEMKFITDDALYSGLQGALTSWILGGVGDISTAVNETSLTRLGKEMRSYEDAYIDAAGQYGLTDSIEEYNESEKTDMDLGKLISDVLAETRRNNEEQFVSGIGKNHADRMGSVREAAEKMGLNALIGKYDESEKTDHDTGEFILGVQEAIGSDIINAKSMDKAEAAYAKATKDAPEYVKEVADNALGERIGAEIKNAETMEEAQSIYNDNVSEEASDVIRQKADDAMSERQIENARERANEAFGVDRMSENTQNVKREMAKSTNADQEHFSDGFNYYYAYGRSGESFERAVNADENSGTGAWNLTNSEKRLAWEQGRQDYNTEYENRTAGSRVEGSVRYIAADEISEGNRAKGIREVRDGEVSKNLQTAVMGLSVFNGVNTVLYASDEVTDETGRNIGKTAPNGWYNRNTNTIYIDVTAENAGKNAVMMVYAHEFTHSLQENAPTEYKALRDYIVKTFESDGKTLNGLIEEQLTLANENGVNLTREQAVDEVIADACQELFKNSKAIDDLAQNNPKVFNKLRDFIKKAIASIRKVLKRSETTSEEAIVLRGILGDLTEAQRLYDDAVKVAATRETVKKKQATASVNGARGKTATPASNTAINSGSSNTTNSTNDNSQNSFRQPPTTDTSGRQLSKGQSEYFKDSAIRDGKGNLMVMYHGTPYGGFTQFKNGLTYFTPSKEYADRYHNPSASSVRGRYDPATKEQTYEVYLNITKPFDIRNAEDRKIFIDEYVKGGYAAGINPYLSRSEIEKQIAGGIDWMEADNLYEFIMDNEYDYDGLVLNEGADGGYGDEVTQRGLSYMTFSPEQAKNVDNTNPTKSKDLRFNLRAPVEKSRDLVAYHNISVEKLAKALNLGGLAAPSFAVTKRGVKHTGFGGITLIAPRSLIDPEVNSNASLFTRDAWTPTVPNTVIKLDDKAVEDASKKLGMSAAFLKGNLEGVRTEKDAVERLKDFIQAKRAFVKEKGYEVEPVLHDAKTDYLDVKELQDYIREENITAGRIMNDENVRKNILKTVEDSFENKTGKTAKFIKNAKIRRLNELFERLANTSLSEKYFDKISEEIEVINGKTGKVMTENSYEEGLDNLIKEKSDEYEAFISDAVSGMIESEWIEKSGVEPYYQDGTRKSWNQLYRPLTLDNLVLEMKNQPEQGAGGYANIKGMAAEKMSSVEEARARKNQIKELSSEELKEINHKIFEKTKAITDKIMNESEFASMFDVEEDIVESLQTNDTRDEVYRDLVRFYPKLTRDIVDEIYDLIDYMRSQPVSYFEAKVMDAVGIEQFEAAVVPENLPQEMKDALREKGLDVTEYDPESEENRVEATNEAAEDYQFSFRKPNSPRRILADALDSATQTDEEKRLLKEYKSSITATETLEFLVGEMKKAAETAETAEERDMYLRKAGWYSDAVRVNDKKLLEMEATEPLKNVMEREAEARKKEGAEGIMKRYAARDERRRMREIRDRSKTEIANLTRMITKPNKKDYVPDVLKKTVGDFIQSIDFVSKYADPNSWNTEQWRSKMYNLAAVLRNNAVDGNETGQGDTAIGMDPTMFDPDLLRQIDAFIKNHEGKNISDLDSAGLADLYIITRKLRMGIRNYNRMFTNKRFESIERAGYETIEMLDEKKTRSRKRDIGIIGVLDKLFNVDMLEPKSYFKRFGKAGESIYEAIAEGDDRNKSVLQDASEYVAGVYKRLGIDAKTVRKWGGRKAKQSFDIRGNNITLTPLQIMTLYELSKREQAMRHINRGGIIVQGEDVISVNEKDPSGKQTNEGEKAVTLFDDDVKMITDTLTDEQKAFADELQKWMANEGAAYGNEVSMKMYGSKNFTEQNYFPIKTDSNSRNASTNEDSGYTNLYRILNLGMTKTVDETARNAVIITDIMSAFSEHVADMASYYGYAMPIADAMKWFNYRYDIGHETKSVRGEMDRVFGSATQQYFKTLLADINGNTALNNDNLFDALIGHYKAAAVGANIRVVIQQPIAYIRALNVMNPKYLAKAFGSKRNFEEMEKYAPIAWWKDSSFRENGMGKSLKSTLTNDMTLTEKWTDFLTKPAGWADKVTWGRLWNAVKYEVKDQYGDMEYEDYMKKCAKRFRQIVDESQVVDTKLSRSQLMRNQNGLTNLATAFMMEPTKTYNMLYDAYTSKNAKKIARATAVWALENIVLIAVKSAYDAFRRLNWSDDEKEKDYLQRFIDSAKTNAADEFIPLNMIPFLKEIPGAFEAIFSDNDNTRAQRFDMQWLYDLTDAVKKNKKFYSGDYNEKDMWKAQESILKLLSNVSGVPISNLYREAKTIKNSVQYQFMGQETIHEQIRRAAQYKYDGEFDKYKEERKKILEERYVLGNKKITSDEFVKMVDSEFAKIKKEAVGENAEEDKDEFEQDKAMYKIGDAKKAVSDGNYRYVQEILDEIYDAGHPVTEEQKADYFESKAKSFKSSLGKLLYKDPEDKDGDGKISDEEKKNKVLSDDYEKKKKEYLKLRIDGKPLFDEDYFLNIEKKDRKNGLDASLEAAGKSADIGASAQSIQSVITEMYNAEKPDERKAEVDYMKNKKQSIKSALTTYYKSQPADVRARLKVIYKKLYISGSKIKLYDNNSFVTMEKDIKAKEKAEKKTG